MLDLLAASLALGIAGFDPLGSAVLVAALGLGARRRGVVILGVTSVGTSLVLALAGTFGLAAAARRAGIHPPHVPHPVWLVAVALVGIGLVAWAVYYLRRPPKDTDGPGQDAGRARPRSSTTGALAVSGLLVGLSSLADPAFWAMIVHAARWSRPGWTVIEAAIWVACSHSLLIALVVAYILVGARRVERLVEEITTRHDTAVRRTVSGAAGGFGLRLLVDVAVALASGSWLFTL